ncbi:MAG: tetratricopeptide repeat protein, partial [Bacteroidia bacterium]
MRSKFILILLIAFAFSGVSQTAKKFFKQGRKDVAEKKYSSAVANFTKALELKPNTFKYLLERARANEKSLEYPDALKDYKSLVNIKNRDEKLIMKVADISMTLKDYEGAVAYLEKIITMNYNNIPAWQKASFCYLKLKKFSIALEKANQALDRQRYNHLSHYYKALALDSMHDLGSANIEYNTAIRLMKNEDPNDIKPLPKYKPYYTNHAWAMFRVTDYENSIKEFDAGLATDPKDTVEPKNYVVFYQQSQAYYAKSDFVNSIGNLNKSLVINPKYVDAFFLRGKINKATSQFQGAISDFTKTFQLDPKNAEAVYLRGQCYLELGNYTEAISDLTVANKMLPANEDIKRFLKEASDKNYQANKESDAPMLILAYPLPDAGGFVDVFTNQVDLAIEGQVNDKSFIKEIKINGNNVPFKNEDKNPFFRYKLILNNADKVDIVITDIYFNTSTRTIKLGRIIDNTRIKVQFAGRVLSDDGSNKAYANKTVYITNEKGEVMFFTKTDDKGYFRFEKLPFDKNYLMTLDVDDAGFSGIDKFKIIDEAGTTILTSKLMEKGKFKFEL